jgi:hypothetical protein
MHIPTRFHSGVGGNKINAMFFAEFGKQITPTTSDKLSVKI